MTDPTDFEQAITELDEIVRTLMEDKLSVFMTDAWVEESGAQNSAAFQCFPYFFVRARE